MSDNNKNVLSLCIRNYKKYLTDELNKHCGYDIRSNRLNIEPDLFYIKQVSENFIDLDPSSDNEIIQSYSYKGNNYVNKLLDNEYGIMNTTADASKLHILEEVYTPEYQASYFLEQ
jgi:hypothetical protein